MADLTPEQIATKSFKSKFRGADPGEVSDYLDSLAEAVSRLVTERDRLRIQVGDAADRDLKSEFENVGREVSAVLQSAREAADQMRERASSDATRWRSEAVSEAESELRHARADSEQLRSDAWSTSEELLKQATTEAERISATTEQERLRLVGESEREAHRIVSAGRREAEEMVRTAKMESERLTLGAQTSHDQVIERANRAAESAQERTRALEIRRNELKAELDEIRHALASAEGELEERSAALELSPATLAESSQETAVEEPPKGEQKDWSFGETVRVVRPGDVAPPRTPEVVPDSPEIMVLSAEDLMKRSGSSESAAEPGPPDEDIAVEEIALEEATEAAAESLETDETAEDSAGKEADDSQPGDPDDSETANDVELSQESSDPAVDQAAEGTEEQVPAETDEVVGEDFSDMTVVVVDQPEPVSVDEPQAGDEESEEDSVEVAAGPDEKFAELSGLFARLRDPAEKTLTASDETAPATATVTPSGPAPLTFEGDPFELRAGLLLPVSNRALRNIKRQLTESQNEALEELRLSDGAWEPDPATIASRIRPDLVVLGAESFAAGHSAAMEMSGERLKRPSTPKSQAEQSWVDGLVSDLGYTLAEGRKQGQGARQLGASVSRVFRAWRTDEAERRVAEVANQAYHTGLAEVAHQSEYSVRWVVAGRGCSMCWANAESVPSEWSSLPPVHSACDCTLVMV